MQGFGVRNSRNTLNKPTQDYAIAGRPPSFSEIAQFRAPFHLQHLRAQMAVVHSIREAAALGPPEV